MKKTIICLSMIVVLAMAGPVFASSFPAWYEVSFTGVDVWTYSADNAGQARTDQVAPRRYRDWTQPAGQEVRYTTYGLNGGLPTTGFNTWAPTSGFAFDLINLWGAGGAGALAWGEKYISVGTTEPEPGESSWKLIQAPTGWTSGIVEGGDPWSADATHAFPVWRSGTGSTLGLANMDDPDFRFAFQVLISNPETAFDPDGKLRVFFGGYNDDYNMTGPQNYEVSGIMRLDATPLPLPGAVWLLGTGLMGLGVLRGRKFFNR